MCIFPEKKEIGLREKIRKTIYVVSKHFRHMLQFTVFGKTDKKMTCVVLSGRETVGLVKQVIYHRTNVVNSFQLLR